MENRKIVKEYDVTGNPFNEILKPKDEKWYQKIGKWFSFKWTNLKYWYLDYRQYRSNIKRFRPFLERWYPWDWESQVKLFAFGLEQLANSIENGNEIDISRLKKYAAIRELIGLLLRDYEGELNDKYFSHDDDGVITHITQYDDGSVGMNVIDEESKKIRENNVKQYSLEYKKTREEIFNRIFELVKGQDCDAVWEQARKDIGKKKKDETEQEYHQRHEQRYYELFDGTGIEGWWD